MNWAVYFSRFTIVSYLLLSSIAWPGMVASRFNPRDAFSAMDPFSDQLLVQNKIYEVKKNRDYSRVFAVEFANQAQKHSGTHLDTSELLRQLNEIDKNYKKLVEESKNSRVNSPFESEISHSARLFLQAASAVGPTKVVAGVARAFLDSQALIYDHLIGPTQSRAAAIQRHEKEKLGDKLAEKIFMEARKKALLNPAYGQMLSIYEGDRTQVSWTADTHEILDPVTNSEFARDAVISQLRPYLTDHGIKMDSTQATDLALRVQELIHEDLRNFISEIPRVALKDSSTSLSQSDPESILASIPVHFPFENFDNSRAVFSVLGSIVGMSNEGAGKVIQTLGGATLDLIQSTHRLTEVLRSQDPNIPRNLFLFSGDLLSFTQIVLSVVNDQPSFESLIMENLAQLRRMIGNLGDGIEKIAEGMDRRFDHVDEEINQIKAGLFLQARLLAQILTETHQGFRTVQNELTQIQEVVRRNQEEALRAWARTETSINRQFQAMRHFNLDEQLNHCKLWENTFDGPMPDQKVYKCLTKLKTYIDHRSDPIDYLSRESGQSWDFSTEAALRNFGEKSLDQLPIYLYRLSVARSILPNQGLADLGNLTRWAAGSQHLVNIMSHYPGAILSHSYHWLWGKGGDLGYYRELIQIGESARSRLASIQLEPDQEKVEGDSSEAKGYRFNPATYSNFLKNYEQAVTSWLVSGIDSVRDDIASQKLHGLDPWLGLDRLDQKVNKIKEVSDINIESNERNLKSLFKSFPNRESVEELKLGFNLTGKADTIKYPFWMDNLSPFKLSLLKSETFKIEFTDDKSHLNPKVEIHSAPSERHCFKKGAVYHPGLGVPPKLYSVKMEIGRSQLEVKFPFVVNEKTVFVLSAKTDPFRLGCAKIEYFNFHNDFEGCTVIHESTNGREPQSFWDVYHQSVTTTEDAGCGKTGDRYLRRFEDYEDAREQLDRRFERAVKFHLSAETDTAWRNHPVSEEIRLDHNPESRNHYRTPKPQIEAAFSEDTIHSIHEGRLQVNRKRMWAEIQENIRKGKLDRWFDEITLSQLMLQRWFEFALPVSVQNDLELRTLLFDPHQKLLSGTELKAELLASSWPDCDGCKISGPADHPVIKKVFQKIEGLRTYLENKKERTPRQNSRAEPLEVDPLIQDALDRLKIAEIGLRPS